MKNKKSVLILTAVFALVIVGSVVLYDKLGSDNAPDQIASNQSADTGNGGDENSDGDKIVAPDFTVYDADGNAYSLSDFRGKPVVVNFWASWCGPCQMEMPVFEEAYKELGDKVHFLMVNMTDGSQETLDSAKAFIAETEYTFPVYYDTAYSAAYAYGVRSLPTTYFIDDEGYGIGQAFSSLDRETLQKGIDLIYEE